MSCVFCRTSGLEVWKKTRFGLALHDRYPVSEGHTLIVPHRHVESFFDLSFEEQSDLLRLVVKCRNELIRTHEPSGFNVGVNDGVTAGQTVLHAHIHLIPRYQGDQDDPRGGVRFVLPDKAPYWEGGDQ